MPCRPSSKKNRLKATPRVLAALQRLEINCGCKPSLIPSCIAGALQGCRERRRGGTCPCRPRWLPECLLSSGQGCPTHRGGKTCRCPRLYMPGCLALGCAARRKGRRCQCPRTPLEMCPHLRAKIDEFKDLTPLEAAAMSEQWAQWQRHYLPALYRERPVAGGKGKIARAGEAAVNLMTVREARGLALWHPGDVRWLSGNERQEREAVERRQIAQGLSLLVQSVRRAAA